MKITIDDKIPFLPSWLAAIDGVEVTTLPPDSIDRQSVANADALIVRTRTQCDASLLEGSHVGFIGSATIGTDHIDMPWCASAGIEVANAPGCNAPAVAQWVLAAADAINRHQSLEGLTLGVVGVGNVGTIVAHYGRCCGMKVLECDPPKGLPLSLEEVAAQADILTFHTPLTSTGKHRTHHLFDNHIASLLKQGATVMNASRGAVTDTSALLQAIAQRGIHAAIDCWEKEPMIDTRLLELADVATPHIAGYSLQGKLRGSLMIYKALADHFGIDSALPEEMPPIARNITQRIAADSYDIMADTHALRQSGGKNFEMLRNTYNFRNEIDSRS